MLAVSSETGFEFPEAKAFLEAAKSGPVASSAAAPASSAAAAPKEEPKEEEEEVDVGVTGLFDDDDDY